MKIYNYEKINNCVLCGSIDNSLDKFMENVIKRLPNTEHVSKEVHPKEAERQERLKRKEEERIRQLEERELREGRRLEMDNPFDHPFAPHPIFERPTARWTSDTSFLKKMKMSGSINGSFNDTIIIVCGNCGLGSKDISFYNSKFKNFNTVLHDNNCHVLFVRGNSDNPRIFNNEEINLSNLKTVPDYSIIKFKSFNCLCLGGSISLDREWKKAQQERINRQLYWKDENFIYNEKEIDDVFEQYEIACVVSSTCPSFAFPGTNSFNKSSWALKDKSLLEDILNERRLMDKVYEKIISKNKKPYTWYYTRYKTNHNNIVNDILFQSLSSQEMSSFNDCVSYNFGINFSSPTKVSYNKNVMDELIKITERYWGDGEGDVEANEDRDMIEGEPEEMGDEFIEDEENAIGGGEELPDDFFEDAALAPQFNGRDFVADILMTEDEEANGTVNTVIGTLRAN